MQVWQRQAGRKAAWLVLVALLVSSFCATGTWAESSRPLKGVALVIGQSDYEHLTQLANPVSDARRIEGLLADLGFKTDLATDENARKLRRGLDGFIEDAEGADVALIYYSGHGIEAGGVNYLVPVDADLSSLTSAEENLIALPRILNELRSRARITIVLLDACRSNPFPKDALVKADAAAPGLPIGTVGLSAAKSAVSFEQPSAASESLGEVIGFAAEPGHAALDGAAGGNSPYAAALVKHLTANAGYEFGQVMTMVTEEVYLATQTRQRPWTNASLRRLLSFGGRVEDGTADDALIAGERRKLLLTIAATPQETRAFVEALARNQSLPLDPLYGMLKELQVDTSAGPEELEKQLRAGADNLKNLIAERIAPIRKDPELIRLAGLADRAQAEGAISLARDYRAKASARADELDQTLDKREAEVTADRIELASAYADYAETAILAFDYKTAAHQYAKAHAQAEGRDRALAFKYKLGEADALGNHGRYKGDNAALRQSIATYDAALELAAREADRRSWATAQNNLGFALAVLGQRESSTTTLKRAVAAYEAALGERTRERVPIEWAETQNNLGSVLTVLGERESGTATLAKAVAAYEAALTEHTRERAPLQWATALSNLANALQVLGQRESGTTTLKRAASAYEAALTQRTRERVPLQWAETQNNLGNVLTVLGQRENGITTLRRAAAVYEAALTERTREQVPLQWAETENNLGIALTVLGQRESGTTTLNRAVAAYEAALTERTRERVPLQWGDTQNNLGNVLTALGERETGTATLAKAVAAYEATLTEHTRERVPLQWATAQNNLGNALQVLGQRESGPASLKRAVAAYEAALIERTRERVPLQWADVQNNLGNVFRLLGERESGTVTLTKAVAAYEAALTERTRERVPLDWAMTQNNLGNVLTMLGTRESDTVLTMLGIRESGTTTLAKAVAAYEAALTERTRERVPLDWAMTQNNLGNAFTALGSRESGTVTLARAVAAYEAALAERTRERVPLDWAMTQNNLGNVLAVLGTRENGTATLIKAVAAYEAALTEYTRERVPLQWATVQNSLGGTKLTIGIRTRTRSQIASGKQAVEAARDLAKSAGYDQHDDYFRKRLKEFDDALAGFARK